MDESAQQCAAAVKVEEAPLGAPPQVVFEETGSMGKKEIEHHNVGRISCTATKFCPDNSVIALNVHIDTEIYTIITSHRGNHSRLESTIIVFIYICTRN